MKNLRTLVVTVLLMGAFLVAAPAATIVESSGALTGSVVLDLNTLSLLAFDVRGPAVLDVSNPGPVGSVLVSDFGQPTPNNQLVALNPTLTQALVLTLDGTKGLLSGNDFFVGSTSAPITAISDAALAVILQPLTFDFSITSATPISANILGLSLVLNTVTPAQQQTTPEPATVSLCAISLIFGAAWRRRSRA